MIDNYEKPQRDNSIPKAAIATISLAMPVIGRAVAPKVAAWAGSLIGSSLGYKATEKILPYAEKKFDPWSNGLKEKYHVNMPSITGQASQKSLPSGIISNSAGALSSEGVNKAFNDTAEKIDKEGVIK